MVGEAAIRSVNFSQIVKRFCTFVSFEINNISNFETPSISNFEIDSAESENKIKSDYKKIIFSHFPFVMEFDNALSTMGDSIGRVRWLVCMRLCGTMQVSDAMQHVGWVALGGWPQRQL